MKRVYEAAHQSDGYRVLVDRLWPRGQSKAKAQIDCWLKDVAPSSDLRRWFNHEPEKFERFTTLYKRELKHEPTCTSVEALLTILRTHDNVTLVYAAKNPVENHVVVLMTWLNQFNDENQKR